VGHHLHDYLASVSLADVAAGRVKSRRPEAA
jgi:hypothetical protein